MHDVYDCGSKWQFKHIYLFLLLLKIHIEMIEGIKERKIVINFKQIKLNSIWWDPQVRVFLCIGFFSFFKDKDKTRFRWRSDVQHFFVHEKNNSRIDSSSTESQITELSERLRLQLRKPVRQFVEIRQTLTYVTLLEELQRLTHGHTRA